MYLYVRVIQCHVPDVEETMVTIYSRLGKFTNWQLLRFLIVISSGWRTVSLAELFQSGIMARVVTLGTGTGLCSRKLQNVLESLFDVIMIGNDAYRTLFFVIKPETCQ